MEDVQFAASFSSHLCYAIGPGKIMADGEAYKFKRMNLLQRMTKEIGVRLGETKIFPGLEDMFNLSDQCLIISRSAKIERDAACVCLAYRWGYCTTQCGVTCKKEERIFLSIRRAI